MAEDAIPTTGHTLADLEDKARTRAHAANKRTEGELSAEEVKALAQGQHIWLNAFRCIQPTEAFLADIGRAVLKYLDESEVVDDFIGACKVTYIRINKS